MSKPTKGEWLHQTLNTSCGGCHYIGTAEQIASQRANMPHTMASPDCIYVDYGNGAAEALANAALIAEAGTVYHETGYTPRQLMQQRDDTAAQFEKVWDYAAKVNTEKAKLLKACKQALYDLKGREHDQYLRDIIAKMEAAP